MKTLTIEADSTIEFSEVAYINGNLIPFDKGSDLFDTFALKGLHGEISFEGKEYIITDIDFGLYYRRLEAVEKQAYLESLTIEWGQQNEGTVYGLRK